MDTSKTYIKMCDCEEIQNKYRGCDGNPVFLPRQDQLQEMVELSKWEQRWIQTEVETLETLTNGGYLAESRLYRFFNFVFGGEHIAVERTEYSLQFASMEQLWLAFVMKEKYSKVWDGEKWVI